MSEPARPASASDVERRDRLRALLREAADASGFIAFDRFMDIALYGEGVGFYTRGSPPFGREGAYYTAAHASPLFGHAIAERIRAALAAEPHAGPLRVLELGPGDGTLGEHVVERLARHTEVRGRIEYVLVDRSPVLSAAAFERVSAVGNPAGIPVSAAEGIGTAGPFSGVVLANEVLDAQPARRLRFTEEGWQELGVRLRDERLVPAEVPLTRGVPAPELPRSPPVGTVLEVSPMAEGFVREVADHLVSGLFLVLDYGMEESELLAAHPSGTLAAVRRHRNVEDPLSEPGESDLSVFVNFTRVRSAATSAGFTEMGFRRQAEALGEWGFPALLEEAIRAAPTAEAQVRLRLGAKNLLFGFERFCALELSPPKGVRGMQRAT
jgi:SAM-dependent MidA family methyltransferase